MNIGHEHYIGVFLQHDRTPESLIKNGFRFQYKLEAFTFYSSHDLITDNIYRGRLKEKELDKILINIADNQSFMVGGKWSLASYGQSGSRLTLVRDVLGLSPLYYFRDDSVFAFSSSLKMLLELEVVPHQLNNSATARFLFNGDIDTGHETLFHGINEVGQGEYTQFNPDNWNVDTKSYRHFVRGANKTTLPYDKVVKENRQSIMQFVQENYEKSGTNSTLFLSGGLDSSCLAAILSDQYRINSFLTVGYDNPTFDECHFAHHVAGQYPNIAWEFIKPNGFDFLESLETMHRLIDFPTFSTGTFNQFCLLENCKAMGATSAWDGLGADALYGGHDSYRHRLFKELVSQLKLNEAMAILNGKNKPIQELYNVVKSSLKNQIISSRSLSHLLSLVRGELKLYNPDFLKNSVEMMEAQRISMPLRSLKAQMNHDYFNGVRHLARFTDRLSDHYDVDMRYPFSENIHLAQAVSQIPIGQLFDGGRSKAILRDSFKDELPSMIYNRRDKKGLPSPNNLWMDMYKEHWLQYFDKSIGHIYDVDYIHKNYQKIWSVKDRPENYRLFKHISFAIWYKVFALS